MAVFFLVSFLAGIVGAICGIGGGVIIKSVLDMLQLGSVSGISFLSGCTVLSMSCYSVGSSLLKKERVVNIKTGTPLAVGAAIGGVSWGHYRRHAAVYHKPAQGSKPAGSETAMPVF